VQIDDKQLQRVPLDTQGVRPKREGAGAAPPAVPPAASDRVEVSDAARARQVAAAALKGQADLRTQKLAALKAAVQAGTYRVSGEDIAEKMLEEEAAPGGPIP
jgi:negative regulator of flagellin synthesis FlgM